MEEKKLGYCVKLETFAINDKKYKILKPFFLIYMRIRTSEEQLRMLHYPSITNN